MHLSPTGRGVEAARNFERAGGTHLILSHMPYKEAPLGDYKRQYEITLSLAESVRKQTHLEVFVTLGPYPVDYIHLSQKHGARKAMDIMKGGMELAGKYVKEGKAIGIGEIGRPHFAVDEETLAASNEIMKYGMMIAKDVDCAVVLHLESGGEPLYREIAEIAFTISFPLHRIVRHYAPPIVDEKKTHGIFPSVLAKKEAVVQALKEGTRFLMETDYIDDPKRPGAVLSPTTVPKRMRYLIREGFITVEEAEIISKENAEKVYGISFD